MKMDLEKQKEKFKNHKATFTDYGNIKILDFKNPESSNYRIRFLFEEDYCRLHISGDLGELIASNYSNMTYEKFSVFVNNTGYFEEKIDCHNRLIYFYDEDKAREDIIEHFDDILDYFKDYDFIENVSVNDMTDDEIVNDFLESVLENFSDLTGIGEKGYDLLSEIDGEIWEVYKDFGKRETGILDLYMLAFKLAKEQLDKA